VSLSCQEARGHFERYAEDTLADPQRRAVREHVRSCPPCRGEAAAAPGLFFGGAPPEDVSPEEAARILSGIRAGIALKSAERRLGVAPARRRAAAAACAAAIVAFTLALSGGPAGQRPPSDARAAGRKAQAPTALLPAAFPTASSETARAATEEKQKSPSNATIYDWNPGGQEPRVVWIVDRSLDI